MGSCFSRFNPPGFPSMEFGDLTRLWPDSAKGLMLEVAKVSLGARSLLAPPAPSLLGLLDSSLEK